MNDEIRPTRRAFMSGVARKAVYVAPAVLALKAAQRAGAEFTGCAGPLSPCLTDPECCVGTCQKQNQTPCMGQSTCTCQ